VEIAMTCFHSNSNILKTVVTLVYILISIPSISASDVGNLSNSLWKAIFIHPLQDTCFSNNSPIMLAISLPSSLFLADRARNLQFKILLNDTSAGEGFLHGDDMAEDGFSLIVSVPYLSDGQYAALFTVFVSDVKLQDSPDRRIVATGETRFTVDSAQACEEMETAPDNVADMKYHSDAAEIINLARGRFARMSSTVRETSIAVNDVLS
jgi:hypothetical protein